MGKKTEAPRITVRQRKGAEGIMTGANTELLIDGKPLPLVHSFKFSVNARGVAKATIEMFGRVEIDGILGQLEQVILPLTPGDE